MLLKWSYRKEGNLVFVNGRSKNNFQIFNLSADAVGRVENLKKRKLFFDEYYGAYRFVLKKSVSS